jgi:hypothetical protein
MTFPPEVNLASVARLSSLQARERIEHPREGAEHR